MSCKITLSIRYPTTFGKEVLRRQEITHPDSTSSLSTPLAGCYTTAMYAGIDIGGTKTLVAVFDADGTILTKAKFPTPPIYEDFVTELTSTIQSFQQTDFVGAALAMPVTVFDREHGIGVAFSNLPWRMVPIQRDIEKLLQCPLTVDNDAKLGGLYEALQLQEDYHKVLYLTISTGIGFSFVVDGIIDKNAGDSGGGAMMFDHNGKNTAWEQFASGSAIVRKYGKRAMDIEANDTNTWSEIARGISVGLVQLIAIFQPEVIVIGGSVGTYFERYGEILSSILDNYKLPLVAIPPLVGAINAEEAVVYGCYELAKKVYEHGTTSL